MECDMCGADENLVKVKNELGETIYLCQACYNMQQDGYERAAESDLNEDELEDLEENEGSEGKGENDEEEDFLEDDDEEET